MVLVGGKSEGKGTWAIWTMLLKLELAGGQAGIFLKSRSERMGICICIRLPGAADT